MSALINIAVDGFASCGKSTLAVQLARALEYKHIDTGAMYRAITLYFIRNEIDFASDSAVREALESIKIHQKLDRVRHAVATYLNDENVEDIIRDKEVSDLVSEVSVIGPVRTKLVQQQQIMGKEKGIVMDGRDIGTVVFPDAELKLFITASIEIRAKRRYLELLEKGIKRELEEIRDNLIKRDHIDSTREISPLKQADDAIVIDTSELTPFEQLHIALKLASDRISEAS